MTTETKTMRFCVLQSDLDSLGAAQIQAKLLPFHAVEIAIRRELPAGFHMFCGGQTVTILPPVEQGDETDGVLELPPGMQAWLDYSQQLFADEVMPFRATLAVPARFWAVEEAGATALESLLVAA